MTYEDVVFFQGDAATEHLDLLENEGPEAVVKTLSEWHYPNEHEIRTELPHGTTDRTFEKDGYILSWNRNVGTIGLLFKIDKAA